MTVAELTQPELEAIVGWALACDGDPEDWPLARKIANEMGIKIDAEERTRLIQVYDEAQGHVMHSEPNAEPDHG